MFARLAAAVAVVGFVLSITVPAHAERYCAYVVAPDDQQTTVTACTP